MTKKDAETKIVTVQPPAFDPMPSNTSEIVLVIFLIMFVILMYLLFGYTLYLATNRSAPECILGMSRPFFVCLVAFVGIGPFGFFFGNIFVAVLCICFCFFSKK